MPFINTTTEVKVQGVLYTGKVHFVAVPFVSLEIQKLGSPAIKITLKSSKILLHSHSMRFAQMFCDSWPHPKMFLSLIFITKSQSSRQFSFRGKNTKMCNANTEENKQDMESYCSLSLFYKMGLQMVNFRHHQQYSEPLITAPLQGHFSKVCVKEIKYTVMLYQMVLHVMWYPFDYMSDTFPQRSSTSTQQQASLMMDDRRVMIRREGFMQNR